MAIEIKQTDDRMFEIVVGDLVLPRKFYNKYLALNWALTQYGVQW